MKSNLLFSASRRSLRVSAVLLSSFSVFASAQPTIISDSALVESFENNGGVMAEADKETLVTDLVASLKTLTKVVPENERPKLSEVSPANRQESTFIVSSVYDCGNCDRWHMSSVSTAWALSSDGVMVTNHHVMANAKGKVMAISDSKGNLWPVSKVLATDKEADICIFKVKGTGFKPLALAKPAPVGSDVEVIGHPGKRFFTHTFGKVTRYYSKNKGASNWMSISADFAQGSSGGPVINPKGEIVGMVSYTNTLSVASPKKNGSLHTQMVIKSCAPVSAIWRMLGQSPE